MNSYKANRCVSTTQIKKWSLARTLRPPDNSTSPHSRSSLTSLLGKSSSCFSFWFYDLSICPGMADLSHSFVNSVWMRSSRTSSSVTCIFSRSVCEISPVGLGGYGLLIFIAAEYCVLWIHRCGPGPHQPETSYMRSDRLALRGHSGLVAIRQPSGWQQLSDITG